MQNYIISSDVGAISEQIDSMTGSLIKISNASAPYYKQAKPFSFAMKELLNLPFNELRNKGKEARKRAVDEFDNSNSFDSFLQELCIAETTSRTKKPADPLPMDEKNSRDMLYNNQRFILI